MRKYILFILFLLTLSAQSVYAQEDWWTDGPNLPNIIPPGERPDDPVRPDPLDPIIPDKPELPDPNDPIVPDLPDIPGLGDPGDYPGGDDPGDYPGGDGPGDYPGGDDPGDYPGGDGPDDYPDDYPQGNESPNGGAGGGGSPPYDPNYLEGKEKFERALPNIISLINTNLTVNTKYSDLKITNEVNFEYIHTIAFGRARKNSMLIEVGYKIINMSLYDQASNIIHELAHLYRDPCRTELIEVKHNPPLICEPVNESHKIYLQNQSKKAFNELSSLSNIVQSEKELYEESLVRYSTKPESYIRNEINALTIELELMGDFMSQEYREKQQTDLWTWQMILNALEKQKITN